MTIYYEWIYNFDKLEWPKRPKRVCKQTKITKTLSSSLASITLITCSVFILSRTLSLSLDGPHVSNIFLPSQPHSHQRSNNLFIYLFYFIWVCVIIAQLVFSFFFIYLITDFWFSVFNFPRMAPSDIQTWNFPFHRKDLFLFYFFKLGLMFNS